MMKIADCSSVDVGYCFDVDEDLVDAMTAISGGGHAYLYLAIEALTDGALLRAGLNRKKSNEISGVNLRWSG